MGKVLQAIKDSHRWARTQANYQEALRYIETGDPAALRQIKPSPRDWVIWIWNMRQAMSPTDQWDEEDRRGLHVMAATQHYSEIGSWLSKALMHEKLEEDLHGLVRGELERVGVAHTTIATLTAVYVPGLSRAGRPTSAGRFLLSCSDRELKAAVSGGSSMVGNSFLASSASFITLTEFLLEFAPDRLPPLVDHILDLKSITPRVCQILLEKDPARYETEVASHYRLLKNNCVMFSIAQLLYKLNREKYGREALEVARSLLAEPHHSASTVGIWMVEQFGAEVLEELVTYLEQSGDGPWYKSRLLSAIVKVLGADAIPAVLAALRGNHPETRLAALGHLLTLDDGTHEALIRSEIERGLEESRPEHVIGFLKLIARWNAEPFEERLWTLLGHKSKPVRDAAARALGRLGDAAVPRAVQRLEDKKADVRAAAVTLLAAINTQAAWDALEARLDLEANDDVRDAMLLALDAARAAVGREVTREEVEARIAKAAPKLKAPVAGWLDEARLPPLRYQDGTPLGPEAVRYLLYRQSRAREIRADVEARPLYALIDRGTSGDFALEVLKGFVATKAAPNDRWALATAALLGDDRVVPLLNSAITQWAESSRGKMAEYAVQALALLGTDAALTTLDALSLRYRTKYKNIGQMAVEAFAAAAGRLGVTPDELGDRIVPWLGFAPHEPRIIDCGGRKIEVEIGPDFKLKYRDLEKNKPVASLPRTAPKEVLDAFKGLAATLREVVKAQVLRLEHLMVRQYRWPVARWPELFLAHPLLRPFAARLVWGAYDDAGTLLGTFRTLDDRSLTDASDDEFVLPGSGTVGIVHPLELDEATRSAWLTHLADYEVTPPFPQLERPVVRVRDDQRTVTIAKELEGTSLNALTFKGRAEKLGWARGSVTDGGGVDAYRKCFPAAGVDAFLGLDGMYVGIGMDGQITLGDVSFVKSGSVAVGSYVYDNPTDANDPRLIPFGAVPPVVFSEVMGDLSKIAGRQVGSESEAEEAGPS